MIDFMFTVLVTSVLFVGLLIVVVGGLGVLKYEIQELLGIDIAEKVKEWHESKVLTKTGRGQN